MTDTTSTEERAMSGTDDRLREALARAYSGRTDEGWTDAPDSYREAWFADTATLLPIVRAYGDLRAAEELRAAANGVDGAGVGIVGLPGAVKQALGIAASVIRERAAALTAREEAGR